MIKRLYKKILVPYDGSVFSEKALETAKTLSKSYNATLYLITILDISDVSPPGLMRSRKEKMTMEEIKDSLYRSYEVILKRKERECKSEEIRTITHISTGSAADELLKFMMKNDIDLVVLGSKGLGRFSKLRALGSVSKKVSELSKCAVMLVH